VPAGGTAGRRKGLDRGDGGLGTVWGLVVAAGRRGERRLAVAGPEPGRAVGRRGASCRPSAPVDRHEIRRSRWPSYVRTSP